LAKLGTIIHIRVEGVRLRNCPGGPEPDTFEHTPFAREALDQSVIGLVREGDVPDFQNGYAEWRKGCGDVYTITVSDAIRVAEETLRENLGCESASNAN
jgi:hypothetical protein